MSGSLSMVVTLFATYPVTLVTTYHSRHAVVSCNNLTKETTPCNILRKEVY